MICRKSKAIISYVLYSAITKSFRNFLIFRSSVNFYSCLISLYEVRGNGVLFGRYICCRGFRNCICYFCAESCSRSKTLIFKARRRKTWSVGYSFLINSLITYFAPKHFKCLTTCETSCARLKRIMLILGRYKITIVLWKICCPTQALHVAPVSH